MAIVLDKLKTNTMARVGVARLSVCRGGRDPTERGAYHDILLCCQTEKCLLRMRDGVRSDVSGAAFNCGVPSVEDGPYAVLGGSICCRCCLRQRLFYKLILFYDIAFVLLIVACVAQIAFRIASRQLDSDSRTARQRAECIYGQRSNSRPVAGAF